METNWISVKDRLPIKDNPYIVFSPRAGVVATDGFDEEGFFYYNHDGGATSVIDVTHWMRLPEPPGKEGK